MHKVLLERISTIAFKRTLGIRLAYIIYMELKVRLTFLIQCISSGHGMKFMKTSREREKERAGTNIKERGKKSGRLFVMQNVT